MDVIEKLYIEPTSYCNLNCSMCFRNNWIDEKLTSMTESVFEKIYDFLKKSKTVKSVMFAGMGEPLIHKNIVQMVRKTAQCGIFTELLTNATLLDENISKQLSLAGLGRLWISVDEFEDGKYEQIQQGSELELIKKNISYFSSVRGECGLGMTTVLMKENAGSVDSINAFADKYGFDMINLSHVIPCAPLRSDECIYDDLKINIGKQPRINKDEVYKRKYNFCPFIEENNCFVRANGDIIPCMQLLHSSYTYLCEEKRCVKSKNFGNVENISVEEAWKSAEYKKFRKNVREFNFPDCTLCDGCDDRLSNETDCMYNSHPTCGACLWAQGIARCP